MSLKGVVAPIIRATGLAESLKYMRDKRNRDIQDFDQLETKIASLGLEKKVSSKRRVAVLPAAGAPGGLGDEALLRGLMAYCSKHEIEVAPIAVFPGDKWDMLPEAITTLPRSLDDWEQFARDIQELDWVYIIGADIMDGGYGISNTALRIKVAYVANLLGIGATITGFSFNNSCARVLLDLFRKLSKKTAICLRDPFSKERFDRQTGLQATQVTDLAFLMPPDLEVLENRDYFCWINSVQEQGGKLLGLNICPHTAKSDYGKQDPQAMLNQIMLYEEAVVAFLERHPEYSVLLIPHDYRGILSDLNQSLILANRIARRLSKARVNVVDSWCKANEIKAIASLMNVVFTGRMHLAIASVSSGTPVACFTYQDKFEGLFQLLKLDMSLLAKVSESSPESLLAILEKLAGKEEGLRESIDQNATYVKNMTNTNFALMEEYFSEIEALA